jgi:hypothetical protein
MLMEKPNEEEEEDDDDDTVPELERNGERALEMEVAPEAKGNRLVKRFLATREDAMAFLFGSRLQLFTRGYCGWGCTINSNADNSTVVVMGIRCHRHVNIAAVVRIARKSYR